VTPLAFLVGEHVVATAAGDGAVAGLGDSPVASGFQRRSSRVSVAGWTIA